MPEINKINPAAKIINSGCFFIMVDFIAIVSLIVIPSIQASLSKKLPNKRNNINQNKSKILGLKVNFIKLNYPVEIRFEVKKMNNIYL